VSVARGPSRTWPGVTPRAAGEGARSRLDLVVMPRRHRQVPSAGGREGLRWPLFNAYRPQMQHVYQLLLPSRTKAAYSPHFAQVLVETSGRSWRGTTRRSLGGVGSSSTSQSLAVIATVPPPFGSSRVYPQTRPRSPSRARGSAPDREVAHPLDEHVGQTTDEARISSDSHGAGRDPIRERTRRRSLPAPSP
jgi:hypothetical protein